MSTPLTDAINALTAYANSVTGASDTNLNDAVHTLADGYGQGGGGTTPVPQKQVNFIDYDGTILYSYTSSEFNELADLPPNPTHDRLTSQGWNWTKTQITTQLSAQPKATVWVGQMYATSDGKTRLYCHFDDRRSPCVELCPNGTVVVDWGDGSNTSTFSGRSTSTPQTATHTYASSGDYVIEIEVTGTAGIRGGSGSSGSMLLTKAHYNSASESGVYCNSIKRIELGNGLIISAGGLSYMYSLESIVIPRGASLAKDSIQSCYSLKSLTYPDSITTLLGMRNNYSISTVSIPFTVTSFDSGTFYTNTNLKSVTIPNGVTSISASAFYGCNSISAITIPSGIDTINNLTFRDCRGVAEYHFRSATPPTLSNIAAFQNISSDCIIYVPVGSLESYQTANNWSTYASYMREETS